jgi:hypothetical protein
VLVSYPVCADWRLDARQSTVYYTSVKKNTVAENNRFHKLSGSLTSTGKLEVHIDLASVDTGIGIRDERVRSVLFNTQQYPESVVTAELDAAALKAWKGVVSTELPFVLNLHGLDMPMKASVNVLRLDAGTLVVTSREPVLVDAADFNLLKGIAELQKLAGLPQVSPVVPVGFTLVFLAVD